MKKRILFTAIATFCALLLTACGCSHEWTNATCDAPKTCTLCGKTQGDAGAHAWQDATCAAPRTCTNCGETQGEAMEHSWEEATCAAPRTCAVCSATEGGIAEHAFTDWSIDGDTMSRSCTVCSVLEAVPADHEALLKSMVTGRWACSRVDYLGSMLPSYYVFSEATPYFEIKEDGSFHVYTVSTEFDGILKFKEYVTREDGIGSYLFFCEAEGSPRMAFILVPEPDDDPYRDEEDPYVMVPGSANALYFKAEPEDCEEVRNALIGNWVSTEEYVNGETVSATGYSLTLDNDYSFTLTTDTQLTGTWSINGNGGYTIEFHAKAEGQLDSFAGGLDLSSEDARFNINLGNDRHIHFVPAANN